MFRSASHAGRLPLLGLFLLMSPVLGGCSSDRMVRPQRDSTNVVQRPTYQEEGEKTLYLGGYAGATYHPSAIPGR